LACSTGATPLGVVRLTFRYGPFMSPGRRISRTLLVRQISVLTTRQSIALIVVLTLGAALITAAALDRQSLALALVGSLIVVLCVEVFAMFLALRVELERVRGEIRRLQRDVRTPITRLQDCADAGLTHIQVSKQPVLAPAIFDDDYGGVAASLRPALPLGTARTVLVGTISDAIVASPRCYVLTNSGELVWDAVERHSRLERRARDEYPEICWMAETAERNSEHIALIGSQRARGYWHWWVDVVPRIWLLDRVNPGLPLAFGPLIHSFQNQTLDLLGVKDRVRILEPGAHRHAKVSFTAGLTGFQSRFPSPLLAEFSDWVRAGLGVAHRHADGRRLYVRRPPGTSRGVENETEVLHYLDTLGFVPVGGNEPLREQAELFSAAELVVGPHGGGLANLVFSRRGTKVVEIFSAEAAQDCSCFRTLTSHLGQPYARLAVQGGARSKGRSPHDDEMIIDLNRLEQALDRSGAFDE
jgi:capsular polysaccharide biosynthesis protein